MTENEKKGTKMKIKQNSNSNLDLKKITQKLQSSVFAIRRSRGRCSRGCWCRSPGRCSRCCWCRSRDRCCCCRNTKKTRKNENSETLLVVCRPPFSRGRCWGVVNTEMKIEG